MRTKVESQWRTISEFPTYSIDQFGQIYNTKTERLMSLSHTIYGHKKITLTAYDGTRHTRSVALLVAVAFVEPPNALCDNVMVLDGNLSNVAASNLVWRPRWFVWKYSRQLKIEQPIHYRNLHVANIDENVEYRSIIHAGMVEGLLFNDIWRSTYMGSKVFPYEHVFEITERM
jgi:hypothetical protein